MSMLIHSQADWRNPKAPTHAADPSRPATWVCAKCGAQVQSETRPDRQGCPKGGFHNWSVRY